MSLLNVLIPLCALFVVVGLVCATVVSLLPRACSSCDSRRPRSTSARAALVAAPALSSTLVCIAVISAASLETCHCAQHDLHHPHLCLAHPLAAQPLVEAAAWFIGAWALLVIPRLVALGRAALRSHRWLNKVRAIPPRLVDGVAVRVVDCRDRSAFTVGAVSPLIIFDRRLWAALSVEQRRAVVHHEAAHVRRRDGFTVVVLRLTAALFPLPVAGRFIESWSAAAELCCDRYAASKLGDHTAVAEALVAVERVRALEPAGEERRLVTAMAALSQSSIEVRVMALLDGATVRGSRLANDVLALSLVAIVAMVATWLWPGDWVHHGIETLIGLLGRMP